MQQFFPIFFSVLYIRAKYCIALLNYFTKNVINSAIAPYFVDVRPSNLLKFLAQMKGIRQEIGKGSNGLFHDSTTEILILFDDVPQAIILVLPGLWY